MGEITFRWLAICMILFAFPLVFISSINLSDNNYNYFVGLIVLLIIFYILKGIIHINSFQIILLLIFLLFNLIPLPRSGSFSSEKGLGFCPRNEPKSIGLGFPAAYVKYYLGAGGLREGDNCNNHFANITVGTIRFSAYIWLIFNGIFFLLISPYLYALHRLDEDNLQKKK